MRIVGRWGAFDAPYVNALLICEPFNIRRPIEFLIDTGASRTTLSDTDATRLGIQYQKLARLREGTTGIGGVVATSVLPRVKLIFKTVQDTHIEELPQIFVLRHKKVDENIKRIPSLLGRDILNKFTLLLNKERGLVVLTDEP